MIAIGPWDSGFSAWDPFDNHTSKPWHPPGARCLALPANQFDDLEQGLIQPLADLRLGALLLIGRTREAGAVLLQTRALNRQPRSAQRYDATGPGVVRTTLPAASILSELKTAGLSARQSSSCEEDVGSHLLYRILASLPETSPLPLVGLLRLPRDMAPDEVNQAVRITASAIARFLPPLSRN